MSGSMNIEINRNQYLELEKIALGAFWPLIGFMGEADTKSVIDKLRLQDGNVFPLPILFDISREQFAEAKKTNQLDLFFGNLLVGHIFPDDFFEIDRMDAAVKIFGTNSLTHPGVKHLFSLEPIFVGGRVELLRRPNFFTSALELTPDETKKMFSDLGWKKVTGFQTRNAPHRAHEYLLRVALELSDGLFIQPLVGQKKAGDFTPEAIIGGYNALIGDFLPRERVVLGVLSTVMRYAGPREAVFHAIVRRNYGCTHFIVGRDHAGVDDWYGLYDAHELTRQFDGELGIEIMRLRGPYYCKKCDGIVTINSCPHEGTEYSEHISGSYMRKILSNGLQPNPHLMRQEVVKALNGIDCFTNDGS